MLPDHHPPGASRLDIVIVNWNSGKRLRDNIESMYANNRMDDFRVFVMDNASSDGSVSGLEGHPAVCATCLPANAGFAAACNRGAAAGQAEHILFLNPDILHTKNNLHSLLEGASHRNTGCACGLLIDAAGKPDLAFQCRKLPTPGQALGELLLPPFLRHRPGALRDLPPAEQPIAVEQPAAACWLLSRAAWQAAGGFDERFFPAWFEDVDLALRLHRMGIRTLLIPEARFIHEGGYSVAGLGKESFTRIYWRNAIVLHRKHTPWFGRLYRGLLPLGMFWRWASSFRRPEARRAFGRLLVASLSPGKLR